MNVESTLESLNLEPTTNVHRAIKAVGDIIDLSRNKLAAANEIIVGLGAPAVTKERTAMVLAKGLIEQVLVKGKEYNPEEAMTVVAGKYMRLVDDQPNVYSIKKGVKSMANGGDTVKSPRASSSNNKKAAALAIFEANQGQSKSEIARKIAAELEISQANALYYVCRVFAAN